MNGIIRWIWAGMLILLLFSFPGSIPLFSYSTAHFTQLSSVQKLPVRSIPSIPYLVSSTQPSLSAGGVIILDLPSFTPLYEHNAHQSFFPASTAKIITALTTLTLFSPEDIITIDKITDEGQLMGLVPGEKMSVENLLYGLLVHSGNDAAYALANAKGYDSFIKEMNKIAQRLQMKDSYFANPAGLDDVTQFTSPYDLALASRELLRHPLLRNIVSTKEITISDVDFTRFHRLSNVNKLLGEIQGLGGLKTGYTEQAGENLVSFYKKNGHEYLVIILQSEDRFSDTKSALLWIEQNIGYTSS